MKKWKGSALILGIVLAGNVHAAGRQWDQPNTGYLELDGGLASYDNYCHQINGDASAINAGLNNLTATSAKTTRSDCDRSGVAFRADLGAHITSHFFAELFYLSYGTSNSHLNYAVAGNGFTANERVSVTLNGYAYGGEIGYLKTFGRLGVYIKGGESLAKLEQKLYSTAIQTSGGSAQSSSTSERHDRSYAPIASIGGVVHLWKRFSLTVNYDHLFNVGNSPKTPETDIGLYTAGVRYAF